MTDKQATKADIHSRLDELERLALIVTDPTVLQLIAEREKVLREALDKLLST